MSELDALQRKLQVAHNRLSEAMEEEKAAHVAYRSALEKFSVALAYERYGFSVGDIIEFTKDSWRKKVVVRMVITEFSAIGLRPDYDPAIEINGLVVKKDGSVGKQAAYCYPDSHKPVLIKRHGE